MESYLPECWNNEQKISLLFEEPRSASANPLDLEHKFKFWSDAVVHWTLTCKVTIFSLADVKNAFSRKGRVPAILPYTVQRMERERTIKRVSEVTEDVDGKNEVVTSSMTRRFISALVVSPLKLGFTSAKWALGYSDTEAVEDSTEFVALAAIEKKAKEVAKLFEGKAGLSVFTAEAFYKEHHELISSEREAVLVLGQLTKNPDLSLVKEEGEYVVKSLTCRGPSGDNHTPVRQKPAQGLTSVRSPLASGNRPLITEAERSLAKMAHTINLLHSEISAICEECKDLREKAANALTNGHRDQAKVYLRKKNRLQQLAEKRSVALSQLETLQETLADAETDNMVLEAYKTVKDALKSTLKGQLDNDSGVHVTLEDLNEVLEDHSEISAALSETAKQQDAMFSTEELEEELRNLLKEEPPLPTPPEEDLHERLEKLRGERVPELPDVPTFSPSKKSATKRPEVTKYH